MKYVKKMVVKLLPPDKIIRVENAMGFNFQRFTDVDSNYAARVTIRQNGQLGFTAGAINKFHLKDYAYCELYYDAENRAVGMRFVKDGGEGRIPFRKSETNTYVRAKNFLDKFEIEYSKSERYELKRDHSSGILYFLIGTGEDENEPAEGEEPAEPPPELTT